VRNLHGMKLSDRLPRVRGRLQESIDLSRLTWFRVGGLADVVYKPADIEDLSFFLQNCPRDIPLYVMGVGSNLLVRDGGVRGVVIRLGSSFSGVSIQGETLFLGAGLLDRNVALMAADAGIGGLEFLAGIPGTIGGALRMNAGAYGTEMKDRLEWAKVMDRDGVVHTMSSQELKMTYRHTDVPKDWIFVACALRGQKENSSDIHGKITEMLATRSEAQPVNSRTGGSTFANPEGHKAWQLIDEAGCRGEKLGGAQVSEKHCNFLINTGNATAFDLESLAESVRDRVKVTSGVDLRWEIERIGESFVSKDEKVICG